MVLNARDLPEARRRRWMVHTVLGLLALTSVWWIWSSFTHLRRLEGEMKEAGESLPALEAAADQVAADCGLALFSSPESLRRFPMEVGRFPSRREMECANRVTKTRSDLIETYLEMDRLRPRLEEARDALSPSVPISVILVVGFLAWIYLGEIRPRRAG